MGEVLVFYFRFPIADFRSGIRGRRFLGDELGKSGVTLALFRHFRCSVLGRCGFSNRNSRIFHLTLALFRRFRPMAGRRSASGAGCPACHLGSEWVCSVDYDGEQGPATRDQGRQDPGQAPAASGTGAYGGPRAGQWVCSGVFGRRQVGGASGAGVVRNLTRGPIGFVFAFSDAAAGEMG